MTNTIKKVVASLMAIASLSTCAMGITASAAETNDTNFSISIQSNIISPSSSSRRLKTNDTSTYVNYKTLANHSTSASGPYKFRCYVYGSDTSTSQLIDLSSYDLNGNARPQAIVTRGTTGYMYQLINETFGPNAYAQLYGSKYSSYTGTAKGCWSSDSVGSGTIYNG